MSSLTVAIVGSGNIGTDLMFKIMRSDVLELRWMVGVDPDSDGLKRAADLGIEASAEGVPWLLSRDALPDLVFEATSAYAHRAHAPRYAKNGVRVVDLTPAAIGPYVVPTVNLEEHIGLPNVNMVTCGGQATIPMVRAVSRVTDVEYAEIVASVASLAAGPGTRANIDEFTRTTAGAVAKVGGARRGKAIIVLNPANPPVIMRDTIFAAITDDADRDAIVESVRAMEADVQTYVPGYRLTADPQFDHGRVAIFVEVEGAGDYFPTYAGNLDIMTAAATKVGEMIARHSTLAAP
ncbi:MAG: acetaldehyde dehydrogenase [Pseudonocardiales bacterium]|nr:acetaldehyde dehydrogenase [Pseudonocardiales bacterium]MDT4906983.1 acetaldehyde dehydrogenase [Pseudonocardiales bacterium]MDT4982127.1 acetaldehyde dehydrogenase [Pseudonocardiales bacterium]